MHLSPQPHDQNDGRSIFCSHGFVSQLYTIAGTYSGHQCGYLALDCSRPYSGGYQ